MKENATTHFKSTSSGDVVVDFSALRRGDYIDPEEISQVTGFARDSSGFAFEVMRLCQEIEAQSFKEGDAMLVKCEGAGIRIMTDSEAIAYLSRRHDQLIISMFRIEKRMNRVNETNLTSDEIRRKEYAEMKMERINRAIAEEVKCIGPRETKVLAA